MASLHAGGGVRDTSASRESSETAPVRSVRAHSSHRLLLRMCVPVHPCTPQLCGVGTRRLSLPFARQPRPRACRPLRPCCIMPSSSPPSLPLQRLKAREPHPRRAGPHPHHRLWVRALAPLCMPLVAARRRVGEEGRRCPCPRRQRAEQPPYPWVNERSCHHTRPLFAPIASATSVLAGCPRRASRATRSPPSAARRSTWVSRRCAR